MRRLPWPWIAAGATLGCAITLGVQFTAKQLSAANTSAQPPKKPKIATIGIKGDPAIGSPSAPVTIVEFSDFECPYCKRFEEETLPKLKQHYIDKGLVRFIHKDLPLPFHQNAFLAATLARCAEEDGKYWEAYQALFNQQNCLTCKGPLAITASTGIKKDKLERCSQDKRIKQAVNINASEAELNGIRATPTFVIGQSNQSMHSGKVVEGALPWEEFKANVDSALAHIKKDTTSKPARSY